MGINGKKGFTKEEAALRLLRTNSVRAEKTLNKANETLNETSDYPLTLVQEIQTEVKFTDRNEALRNKTNQKRFYRLLPPTTPTIRLQRI